MGKARIFIDVMLAILLVSGTVWGFYHLATEWERGPEELRLIEAERDELRLKVRDLEGELRGKDAAIEKIRAEFLDHYEQLRECRYPEKGYETGDIPRGNERVTGAE